MKLRSATEVALDLAKSLSDYEKFIERKKLSDTATGIPEIPPLNGKLFDFQKALTKWSLTRGRAAIFADCGLGKTAMQLEWARHVPGRVLILAPLAVSFQTVDEGRKFGIECVYSRDMSAESKIVVTNYEMLERFDPAAFTGVVLDESSILKSYDGKTRTRIIESFRDTPFRLACTATPAPNDYMELGNHSEFLGVMTRQEMLAMFFVHDGGETQKWRIKGHAQNAFWKWVCSWAVMLRKPSDLGFSDEGFDLPPIEYKQKVIEECDKPEGFLFPVEAQTLQERIQARRSSLPLRVQRCAEIVNKTEGPCLVWCHLNAESEQLADQIPGAVEIKGADKPEKKTKAMSDFTIGEIRVLISKPSICGWGMNWQHCSNIFFVGLSDSYEEFYQAVRRCWRFGQKRTVNVWLVSAKTEGAVLRNVLKKEEAATAMAVEMTKHMAEITKADLKGTKRDKTGYVPSRKMEVPQWLRS